MTPPENETEQTEAKVKGMLRDLGRIFGDIVPYQWGFIILMFPFGKDGRMNYVSNADRPDVVRAMFEFIEATKGQWAKDEEPLGAAAEDEQLGRARQRVAELEHELDKALESRREWMEKTTVDRQRIAELEKYLQEATGLLNASEKQLDKLEGEALNLTQVKDLEYLMEIAAAHLAERSPFNQKWHDRAKKYQELFHERMVKMEEAK